MMQSLLPKNTLLRTYLIRTDLDPARFNWTHRYSQFELNSDFNSDVNLELTRMMTPLPFVQSCRNCTLRSLVQAENIHYHEFLLIRESPPQFEN